MSFAELVLRISCALVSWIVATGHVLILAVLPRVSCHPGPGDPWLATLVLAVPTAIGLFLIPLGLPWRRAMGWVALPLALLIPLGFAAVLPFLGGASFEGAHLCTVHSGEVFEGPVAAWHPWWAPVQLLILLGLAVHLALHWWPAARTGDQP